MSNPAIALESPRAASNPVCDDVNDDDAAVGSSLSTLSPGQEAVIESVDLETPVGRRLLDLGFVKGSVVRVMRNAPLGDPVEYLVRGTRMCLRRSESELIRVRQVTPS